MREKDRTRKCVVLKLVPPSGEKHFKLSPIILGTSFQNFRLALLPVLIWDFTPLSPPPPPPRDHLLSTFFALVQYTMGFSLVRTLGNRKTNLICELLQGEMMTSFLPDLFLRYLRFKEWIVQTLICNACLLVSLTYSDAHRIENKKTTTHIQGQKTWK